MKKLNLLIAISVLITVISCKKNDTGGKATIVAFPELNGKAIYGSVAYIKFGSLTEPSDGKYNLKIEGEAKENHVHIEDMRYGKYYIYTIGYDSISKKNVRGGVGVEIKWSERKKEIDANIAVQ